MTEAAIFADPIDHLPLHREGEDLLNAEGRRYSAAFGGWDLRPDAGDENHNLQAEIYDGKLGEFTDFRHPHNLMLVHQKRLLDGLELTPGDRVLEIGGHRSGALAYLEKSRGIVGSGLDIAPVWVRAQNAMADQRGNGTRWVLGNAEHLPFANESMAAIVAFDVLEHVSRLALAVAELARVLKPGGALVAHMPVQDIGGSLDGLQRWWDAAAYAARQASAGHFHDRMPTRLQMRTLLESKGFQVLDVHSFNVWLQPLHDHKILGVVGKLRHRGKAKAAVGDGGKLPTGEASGFQKVYAAAAVPLLKVLTTPDRIGSMLGIGGSASFRAVKG